MFAVCFDQKWLLVIVDEVYLWALMKVQVSVLFPAQETKGLVKFRN